MNDTLDLLLYEKEEFNNGRRIICGVDEAGRGPLAGPVYAAAVILNPDDRIDGLNDSKKLSEKKREQLYTEIVNRAASYCIASASEQEIDELNILNASMLAMRRAIKGLRLCPDIALVDGNCARDFPVPAKTIVGGDAKSASIAAASILAKVSRDRYMKELAEVYTAYSFEVHKGYPTKAHVALLLENGPCPAHRKTFLKKIFREERTG